MATFGAYLWCATPSRQAEKLTLEPSLNATSSHMAGSNGSSVPQQTPLSASLLAAPRAPTAGLYDNPLQPLAWTAARWAARPMYSTAWPSSIGHSLIAPAANSTGVEGPPLREGMRLYHAIVGCVAAGQDCGYVIAGSALVLAWVCAIAFIAYRHRQTLRKYVSGCG